MIKRYLHHFFKEWQISLVCCSLLSVIVLTSGIYSAFYFESYRAFKYKMKRWYLGIPVTCEPFNGDDGCWTDQMLLECNEHNYYESCHRLEAEKNAIQYFQYTRGGLDNVSGEELGQKINEIYEMLRSKYR